MLAKQGIYEPYALIQEQVCQLLPLLLSVCWCLLQCTQLYHGPAHQWGSSCSCVHCSGYSHTLM